MSTSTQKQTQLNQISIALDHSDFLAVNKPFGYRVHRVGEGQWGLLETCASIMGTELWPVHRLDKGTSGLLIFAKTKHASQKFFELFENKKIKKQYRLLTKPVKNLSQIELIVESHIEKLNDVYISHSRKPSNSKTTFINCGRSGDFENWRALPETGKPHQIRLHAQNAGMPILGDLQYNGPEYFRMALHAETLEFEWNDQEIKIESSLPIDFTNLNQNSLGTLLLAQNQNISNWIQQKNTDCILIKDRSFQDWSAEKLGSVIWIKNYGDDFSENQMKELSDYAIAQKQTCFVRKMKDRGPGVGGEEKSLLTTIGNKIEKWEVWENGIQFQMRSDAGFSPGLFLDQRETRNWVFQNSKSKNVLNLFSYTGGFSVNAASGGAALVTTVDVSSTFLDWSKENFKLNSLEPEKHEFFKQDVLLFLQGAVKRARKWDLIVCDPPTFGRSKDRVWKLEKDFPELIQLLYKLLNPEGKILFTCNFENWNLQTLKQQTELALKSKKLRFTELPLPPIDFGCLDSEKQMSYGFILQNTR